MDDNMQNQPPQKEPFRLDISFDDDDFAAPAPAEEQPRSKGEVYFSNPPKSAKNTPHPTHQTPKRRRAGFAVTGILTVALAATVVFSAIGISTLRDIFALGKEDNYEEVSLSIPTDLTTNQIIDILADKKLINQKALCKLYARFTYWITTQHSDNPKPPEYLAGEYAVTKSMGLEELLGEFKSLPKTTATTSLLFPEGFTQQKILEKIGGKGVTSMELLQRTIANTAFDYPFLKNLNYEGRYYKYEGYLFPDTYEFYIDENPNSTLRRFFDNFSARWTSKYQAKADALHMTIDQVIILASIIQKEAANDEQMPVISGILHNRMNKAAVYPFLNCDSTRDYVKNFTANMDEGTKAYYYSKYDTYQCTGLPVGPVCNPGIAAIEASLNPESNSYYYFQHDKNGKIYLSKNQAEHDKITMQLVIDGLSKR